MRGFQVAEAIVAYLHVVLDMYLYVVLGAYLYVVVSKFLANPAIDVFLGSQPGPSVR